VRRFRWHLPSLIRGAGERWLRASDPGFTSCSEEDMSLEVKPGSNAPGTAPEGATSAHGASSRIGRRSGYVHGAYTRPERRRRVSSVAAIAILSAYSSVAVAGTAKPPRLLSLAPGLTEIAYAAGAGALLVGTVEYSDFPAAARRLPRVGDAWRVDLERVLALAPDVVLAWPTGTPNATIAQLRQLGLDVVEVPTQRLADVPVALRQLGRIAGTQAAAERAAREFESRVAQQRETYARRAPLTVFIEIDDEPVYTVNGRHVISEIVELCGGRNVFADLPQLAPPIATEAVLAADPQVIVTTDDTIADPVALWRQWPRLRAVQAGTVYSLSSDLVTRASPRLAQGVEVTCRALDQAREVYRRRAGTR
jgi:iron complex transport system substrate-binding protein